MTEEKPGHLTAFLRERQAYMLGATLVRKTFRKVHKVVQVSSFQCLLKAKTGSWGRQTPSNAPTVWPNISLSGKTSKCSRGKKKNQPISDDFLYSSPKRQKTGWWEWKCVFGELSLPLRFGQHQTLHLCLVGIFVSQSQVDTPMGREMWAGAPIKYVKSTSSLPS